MKLSGTSSLGVVAGIVGASFAMAQMATSSSPQLYTSAQATQGAGVYAAKCAVCHGAKLEGGMGPALSGTTFSQAAATEQMTAKSLFDRVSTTMPSGAPASLKQNEYEAILAYILQANGYPAGSKPFGKDNPGLDQVKLSQTTPGGEAATTRPASGGVYTAVQAAHGKALYSQNCVICHGGDLGGVEGAPPLTGPAFLSKWVGQPVGALHNFIEKNMPPGNGGALGPAGDADVIAYILSRDNYPAGSSPLPADPRGLLAILMDGPQNSSRASETAATPMAPAATAPAYDPPLHVTPPAARPVPGAQAGGNTNTLHPVENFVPVTDDMLRNPSPSDWLLFRGNYQGWGYSKLDQINKKNVKTLTLVWARLMESGINEATPLIYKGVMYLPNPGGVIQAIDASTGELLWQYRRRLPSTEAIHTNYMLGLRKRSIFLWHDKIYVLSGDNYLVALDAKTGKEVWQVNRGGDYYITNTSGPLVVDGVVVAGSQCQDAPFACFVDGHDAETGEQLWHNDLIPRPGEPGDETWANKPYNERWATDVWGTLTYDPDTNLLYYGSSGIAPASEAQRDMPGATMAGTDTRFAVNPKTGKIIWQRQVMAEDDWDQDCTFEMMPITTPVHPDPKAVGMMAVGSGADSASHKTLTGAPCKNAIMWSLDATNGAFLWAKATAVQNLVDHIDASGQVFVNKSKLFNDFNKVYHICPTFNGGRNWNFSAYSPETNAMYIRINNVCSNMHVRADNIPSKPSDEYNVSGEVVVADGKTNYGRIDAVSVETGKTLWIWETPISNYSPILATAGGILFNGNMDRYLRAIDQTNGKVLWQVRLGSQVVGTPVTYSVNGRQYLAVAAGGPAGGLGNKSINKGTESIDQVSGGNTVYVFALPQ